MATPFLSSLVAILYFGWLWHGRGAAEGRSFLASLDMRKRAKTKQRAQKRLLWRAGSSDGRSTVRETHSGPETTTALGSKHCPQSETNLVSFSSVAIFSATQEGQLWATKTVNGPSKENPLRTN